MNIRHGKSYTKIYAIWNSMMARCRNRNHPHFDRYGGRGIIVCARWHRFENFYEDMGEPSKGMTLDRINNDGSYELGNCRWATRKQQQNNLSNNRIIEHNGKKQSMSEWSRELRIGITTIAHRIHAGYAPEKILSTSRIFDWKSQKKRGPAKFIEFNGARKRLSEWSDETGISAKTLRWRLRRGWSVEKTLTEKLPS